MMAIDRAGLLDDPPEDERTGEEPVREQPQPKFADNPIYFTSANKHILP